MSEYVIIRTRRGATRGIVPDDVEIDVEDLSTPRDLRKALADKNTLAASRVMPIRLIEPVALASVQSDETCWGLQAVRALDCPVTGEGTTVAVLDSGIDEHHPAFAHVKLTRENFTADPPSDANGHGTHCAATVFGGDFGHGRIGVAPGVQRALIGKVLDDKGRGRSQAIYDGLLWAYREGADVISMSLGFDFPGMVETMVAADVPIASAVSSVLEAYRQNLRSFDAITNVLMTNEERAPLIVAAAGNENRRNGDPENMISVSLPAAANHVLSVGALEQAGRQFALAPFSNSGPDIVAPGVDIRSAWPGDGLMSLSGTSAACPYVAGIAALWAHYYRKTRNGKTPRGNELAGILKASARHDVFAEGYDASEVGVGLAKAPP